MLNVVMLSVVMLSVVMLNVVALRPGVVAYTCVGPRKATSTSNVKAADSNKHSSLSRP
jgi:hypothetical protein